MSLKTMKAMATAFLVSIFLAMPGSLVAQDFAAEAALEELLQAFLAGASTNDAEMHDRFWAEDLIYTSAAGKRFGKAEIMQALDQNEALTSAAPGPVYSGRDVQIRVYGDTALLSFTLVARADDDSERLFFNTGVFRKHAAEWRAVSWQATALAD